MVPENSESDNISAEKLTISEKPAPWVAAALAIPGVSLSSDIHPGNESTLVSPLTSKEVKKSRPWYQAGFTCEKCPERNRPHLRRNGDMVPVEKFDLNVNKIIPVSTWMPSEPERYVTLFTKRCKECSRQMRIWSRSKKLADQITITAKYNFKRLRFVTLTLPNYQDVEFGLKDLKKKVRNFRYTKAYQDKVIGSADFYEWTTASDGTFNVHYHAIWIGDYWAHDDLLDTWQHGGARIELVKDVMKNTKKRRQPAATRVLKYVMNYVKKMDRQGLRCQQRTGALYGDK